MRQEGNIDVKSELADATGKHRLLLKFVERLDFSKNDRKAYDFHSLVWESKDGDNWVEKTVITRADFEKGASLRRWISEIHSFDSVTGHAILKIGELQPSGHVEYSWREWDVLNNCQVQVLRVCGDPFETFDGKVRHSKPP